MTRAMRIVAMTLALALAAAAGLHAQAAGADWYIDKPIKDVTFQGLASVKEDDLRPIVKPFIGQAFTLDLLLLELQPKLFALDFFDTLEANALPANDARTEVIIQFVVKEHPTVTSIEIDGNSALRDGEILDKVLLKTGDLLTRAKLKSDESAVRSLYLEKGFTEVAVTASMETNEKENSAGVLFAVVEGLPTTIKEIRFSGNAFASASTLRNIMKTKAQFLFDSGVFQEAKLEEDKTAIVDYYTDRGYVDAKIERVDRTVEEQEGRKYLILTFYIVEGDQWIYDGMSFQGNVIFPTERLQELVFQKPGKVMSVQQLRADYVRITDLYMENGYIFNTFDIQEKRAEEAKSISFVVSITERDKAHIESILFKGVTHTKEFVLRRELPFEEGDIFNRTLIRDGLQNLYNLGYFKSIQPEFPPGSAEGLMNVVINVEEQSTAAIDFGVSFTGADFPLTGYVKVNEKNFLGIGQTVGVNLEASPSKQTLALQYYVPWLLDIRWSVGASLSLEHSFIDDVLQDVIAPVYGDDQEGIAAPDPYASRAEYLAALASGKSVPSQYLMGYDSWDISVGANTGYRLRVPIGWLGVNGGVSSQFKRIDYDEAVYRPYEKTVRDNVAKWKLINKLIPSVYLDGRDYYLNPMTGYYASQSVTLTGGLLFGDRHYIRTDSTLEGFATLLDVPVFEGWNLQLVLAAHTKLSLVLPQFKFPEARFVEPVTDATDLLYIDGMTVARGWTKMYGRALWDSKLELRMPIAREVLWAVTFFDAAALWEKPSGTSTLTEQSMTSMKIDDFFFSFGAGLRFALPQFPIRLYLGKRFQIQDGAVVWQEGGLDLKWFSLDFIISLGGDVF